MPAGTVWSRADVLARRNQIRPEGLDWIVVESVPVHEDIKTGAPGWETYADAWAATLGVLAEAGIRTVCYNFIPVLDWTRTDLAYSLESGARCLRYDTVDAAVFDIHLLARPGAEADHRSDIAEAAADRHARMGQEACQRLVGTIIAGLTGAEESWTLETIRDRLTAYAEIGVDDLRRNLCAFLDRVLPTTDEVGVSLALHPDDPPFPLFGLPRAASTEADFAALISHAPSPANGLAFCTGSLGVRADNDLPAILNRFGDRVRFFQLRSIEREADGARFHEADHLAADAELLRILLEVRRLEARIGKSTPMRPDHGHMIGWDQARDVRPGYPYIGRLLGLAELRGAAAMMANLEDT